MRRGRDWRRFSAAGTRRRSDGHFRVGRNLRFAVAPRTGRVRCDTARHAGSTLRTGVVRGDGNFRRVSDEPWTPPFRRSGHGRCDYAVSAWPGAAALRSAVLLQAEGEVMAFAAVSAVRAHLPLFRWPVHDVVVSACFSTWRDAPASRRRRRQGRGGTGTVRAMRVQRHAYTVCAAVRIPLRRHQATARQCMAPQSVRRRPAQARLSRRARSSRIRVSLMRMNSRSNSSPGLLASSARAQRT